MLYCIILIITSSKISKILKKNEINLWFEYNFIKLNKIIINI